MKLLKRNTVEMLKRAEEDLLATQQQIADVQQERQGKLLDAEPAEIARLDQRIADLHRVLGVYNERIGQLQAKLEAEEVEQRQKDYERSVSQIEKAIAGLASVAAEVEAAIRAVPVALSKYRAAQQAALRSWPNNIDLPFMDELGMDRVERVLHEAFRTFSPVWVQEAREHWSLERKLENIRESASGFSKAESAGYEQMIARLRAGASAVLEPAA
jgi:hypothetical protein